MELFVFLRYGPLEPRLLFLLFFFRLYRSAIFAPPSRELDSVPLRLDPTCHQDASLRIRPIQCVRLGAVWFCFPLLGFLRYAPRSPSAHPRTCCFSKCPRVAATNINGGLKLGEGGAALFIIIPSVFSYSVHSSKRSAPAATSCWIPDSHIQPNHPLAFFFSLFVVSGSSINSSR